MASLEGKNLSWCFLWNVHHNIWRFSCASSGKALFLYPLSFLSSSAVPSIAIYESLSCFVLHKSGYS